jgi:isopenicillin N synthase-like dioxygenase
MMSRWSNGILKSTMHRVRAPPNSVKGGMLPERISLPVFYGPSEHTIIDAIPGTFSAERPKQFKPINASEHIQMRQAKMFPQNLVHKALEV